MKQFLIILGVLILMSATTKVTYDYTKEATPRYVIVKHFGGHVKDFHDERKLCYESQKYIQSKLKQGWVVKEITTNGPSYSHTEFSIITVLIKY